MRISKHLLFLFISIDHPEQHWCRVDGVSELAAAVLCLRHAALISLMMTKVDGAGVVLVVLYKYNVELLHRTRAH